MTTTTLPSDAPTKSPGFLKRLAESMHGRGLAVLLFIGGCACFAFTILMNQAFGSSIGATEQGKALLGGAAIVIDIVGLGLFGLAAGAIARSEKWHVRLVAVPLFLVVLACAVNSIVSIMGFVASERMAVSQARERRLAVIAERQQQSDQAAKERREAQERLAKTQLGFMQAQMRDARGRERRVLSKDFAKGASEIIAEVGKDAERAGATASEAPIVIVHTEGQAELIADATGLDQKLVRTVSMASIAVLLIVLKVCCFPLAGFFWGQQPRHRGRIIDLEAVSQGAGGSALASGVAVGALPAPAGVPLLEQPTPKGDDPDTPAEDSAAVAAELAKELANAPPAAVDRGPPVSQTADEAALGFVYWCRRTKDSLGRPRTGRYLPAHLDQAYEMYCKEENFIPVHLDRFREEIARLSKKLVKKHRLGRDKQTIYTITQGRDPKYTVAKGYVDPGTAAKVAGRPKTDDPEQVEEDEADDEEQDDTDLGAPSASAAPAQPAPQPQPQPQPKTAQTTSAPRGGGAVIFHPFVAAVPASQTLRGLQRAGIERFLAAQQGSAFPQSWRPVVSRQEEQWAIAEARRMKAEFAGRSRKQRGNRVGRMARAA